MTNVHEILDKARAARQRLQPNEAAVLFAAAVRLAAAQGHTLRARLVQNAVESVQPRPPADGDRNIFAALLTRWSRPPPEKEALARLIEKLRELEQQVGNLGKAQARLDSAQRDAAERFDRFEGGTQR